MPPTPPHTGQAVRLIRTLWPCSTHMCTACSAMVVCRSPRTCPARGLPCSALPHGVAELLEACPPWPDLYEVRVVVVCPWPGMAWWWQAPGMASEYCMALNRASSLLAFMWR